MVARIAQWQGLVVALISTATFATSGTLASALLDAGWSSGAAVTARVSIAAFVLTVPAIRQLRGRWGDLRRQASGVLAFGAIAVAACQVCYFNALSRLSVGVALLIEYSGTVLIVLWLWLRNGQRPRRLTVAGAVVAIGGLCLVLNVTGGAHVDPIGALWGVGAAVGLAIYFVISARTDDALPPLVMAWGALSVGAIGLALLGLVHALPMHANTAGVMLAGHHTNVFVPVIGIALIATVIAYVAGIAATRMLGAKVASFVGLTEVLFAVLFAWLFLAQVPKLIQLAGGVLVLTGVALVRADELRGVPPAVPEPALSAGRPAD